MDAEATVVAFPGHAGRALAPPPGGSVAGPGPSDPGGATALPLTTVASHGRPLRHGEVVSVLRARHPADDRLRVGPWRGDPSVAHLSPLAGRAVSVTTVRRCLNRLAEQGYHRAVTAALAPIEQSAFLDAGFEVHERLHLLSRSIIESLDEGPAASLRRGRRADRDRVLEVDEAAFPPFWHLDEVSLDDALNATPSSRFRVALSDDEAVVGYAVTGRAGARGYVQRLAVDPPEQRQGVGSALVLDGLRWLRRWGAREAFVNTQVGNEGAVRLYERLGFHLRPDGLAVLQRSLGNLG